MKCRGLKLNGKRDELLKRVRDCLKSGNHHTLYPSTDNGKWFAAKILKESSQEQANCPLNSVSIIPSTGWRVFSVAEYSFALELWALAGVRKGLSCKGRSRYTSKNSSEKPFDENITSFKTLLWAPPQSH